ncbi:MAG: hypothetical protein AUG51_17550 [Acidobacteria bacterium 13_1_20CM_3_53_8]|nr:MAG: hypothetical protein AUG51_17550 [Acidobacteria bacterium 13_1_20CM_3_53_8]
MVVGCQSSSIHHLPLTIYQPLMLRATVRRLLAIDDPPERTALAFSVGVFIAFSPFLGLHTVMATVIAFLFRFNKIAIYAGTFVNNPFFTLVPIILASYAIGAFVMGRPLSLSHEYLALLKEPHLLTATYWRELFHHTRDVLVPFAIGGLTLSVVCSLAAYPLTLRLLRRKRGKEQG